MNNFFIFSHLHRRERPVQSHESCPRLRLRPDQVRSGDGILPTGQDDQLCQAAGLPQEVSRPRAGNRIPHFK